MLNSVRDFFVINTLDDADCKSFLLFTYILEPWPLSFVLITEYSRIK